MRLSIGLAYGLTAKHTFSIGARPDGLANKERKGRLASHRKGRKQNRLFITG
jgi:hypothetical protein